jgi:hypothetical protein
VSVSGWIGVDLDGTLAEYGGSQDLGKIGKPVPLMLARVKKWIAEGVEVRIMTDRFDLGLEEIKKIGDWTEIHCGKRLPVTNKKDFAMVELWDDRAVGVRMNLGIKEKVFATRRMWFIFSAACRGPNVICCSKNMSVDCKPENCIILKEAGEAPE